MKTINDNLSLTVINDGDGSQCGYSYKLRLAAFAGTDEGYRATAALSMVRAANNWMVSRGYQGETALVMLAQAYEVMDYYVEHLTDQYQPHETGAA